MINLQLEPDMAKNVLDAIDETPWGVHPLMGHVRYLARTAVIDC